MSTGGAAMNATMKQVVAASFLLTGLLLIPLGSSFVSLLAQAREDNTRDIVQKTIKRFLMKETVTFSDPESVDVEQVDIDWHQNPPLICVVVRAAAPNRPTFTQVSKVQEEINRRQPIRFRMVFQRTSVDVVGPKEKPNESSPEARELLSPPPDPEPPAMESSNATTEEGTKDPENSLTIQDASPSALEQHTSPVQSAPPLLESHQAVP